MTLLLAPVLNPSPSPNPNPNPNQVDVAVPPRRLVHRMAREGFPYKEKDATGQRTARKGDLIVYLFCSWPELQAQAAQWLRMLATVGAVYLFFVNPFDYKVGT